VTDRLRVLIVVLGSGGDVYPMIAIGRALAARGHDVHVVSSPHFAPAAREAGLVFHACATEEDERRAMQNPDLWKAVKGFRLLLQGILDNVPETYRIVCEEYVRGRTIILGNFAALGARVARETLGAPFVSIHLAPILLRSRYVQPGVVLTARWTPVVRAFRAFFVPAVDRWIFDPVVAPALNAFRAKLGLPAIRRVFDKWIHSPDLVLGLFPGWFASPQPDWPAHTHLVGFPVGESVNGRGLDAELEEFLGAGSPPIVFTTGTSMAFGRTFFEASVEAIRVSGRRALLVTQYPGQLPSLPDHVRHVAFAPFEQLLPRAAALVHHGGIGTMAAAFAAGIPQIVVPFNFDQPDNAARLRALGAGSVIRPAAYTAAHVARTIDDLFASSTIQPICRSIAERMRTVRPTGEACDLIEAAARASLRQVARAQAS
jgi:UDP:flavonoid glycosyltransferase YjiC (YdhE family)